MALPHMTQRGYSDAPHLFAVGRTFHGTTGDDVRNGTHHGDVFDYSQGGDDTLGGGKGDDVFEMGAEFTTADTINGGKGQDTLSLAGSYALTIGIGVLTSIETFHLTPAGGNYNLTLANGSVANGATITLDATALGIADSVRFFFGQSNATAHETGGDGNDILFGGAKNDTILGGKGNDFLIGLEGADRCIGGTGQDQINLGDAHQSTGLAHDTVVGFNATEDTFGLAAAVTDIDDAIDGGSLSKATFNHDLTDAVRGLLHKNHAIVFTPDAGDFAGHKILVVDQNGKAGYQAGHDCVFDLESPSHLGALSTANFEVSA